MVPLLFEFHDSAPLTIARFRRCCARAPIERVQFPHLDKPGLVVPALVYTGGDLHHSGGPQLLHIALVVELELDHVAAAVERGFREAPVPISRVSCRLVLNLPLGRPKGVLVIRSILDHAIAVCLANGHGKIASAIKHCKRSASAKAL